MNADTGLIKLKTYKIKSCREEVWNQLKPNKWAVTTPVHIIEKIQTPQGFRLKLIDRFNQTYTATIIPQDSRLFNTVRYRWRFISPYYGGLMEDIWIKGRFMHNTYKISSFIFDNKPICNPVKQIGGR